MVKLHGVIAAADQVPTSELVSSRLIERVSVVRGDVADQTVLERALGEYEVDTAFHLAAQTIVGIANKNPASTFEANVNYSVNDPEGLILDDGFTTASAGNGEWGAFAFSAAYTTSRTGLGSVIVWGGMTYSRTIRAATDRRRQGGRRDDGTCTRIDDGRERR